MLYNHLEGFLGLLFLVFLANDQLLGQLCGLVLVHTPEMISFGASDTLGNGHGVPTHPALETVVEAAPEMERLLIQSLEQVLAFVVLDAGRVEEPCTIGRGTFGDLVLVLVHHW